MIASWILGTAISVVSPSISLAPQVVFFNSYTGVGPKVNEWQTVNLADILPNNTKAVHVTGLLLITHGNTHQIADLRIYFRCDESYDPTGSYKQQVIETDINGGQRSPMSAWICLDNNLSFQYKWEIAGELGQYPQQSAYGGNLVIDAILS